MNISDFEVILGVLFFLFLVWALDESPSLEDVEQHEGCDLDAKQTKQSSELED